MQHPPLIRPDALQQELARRRLLRFIMATCPGYLPGWFAHEVCAELDWFLAEVRAGRAPHLMLFAPPRHGKSEIVSRRFPAFALGQDPDLSIIATSYAADLASRMNRDVQRIIDSEPYLRLFPGTTLWGRNIRTVADGSYMRNSDLFEMVNRLGSYRSAGVGGGITGMGGNIMLVDDPFKDAKEANSPTVRNSVWEWFTSTFYTRRMPGGGVLIILTRWHEDDLAGRIMAAAAKGDGPAYRIVNFPAIAEKDEYSVLDGRLLRREGEALHPERYPLDELGNIKLAVGSRVWVSLYQQRPAAASGIIFTRGFVKTYKTGAEPKFVRKILSADTAFKEKEENDFSVILVAGECKEEGQAGLYLLDRWKERAGYPELKMKAKTMGARWKPQAFLIEDKASGQSLIQELKRDTLLPVVPCKADTDKVSRANTCTPFWEAGNIYVPEDAPWVDDFLDQLYGFPKLAYDDDVDAFTQLVRYVILGTGADGGIQWFLQQAAALKKAKESDQNGESAQNA